MANTRSARKNIRKNQRRRTINRARRGAMRTQIKKLDSLIRSQDGEGASKELERTISVIDRTTRKGAVHRNTAARTKSRLTKSVRSLSASRA